jgi:hypothetical protein
LPLIVALQNGKFRVCFDLRALNKRIDDYDFPIPRISELIQKLKGATLFYKLDTKKGFWQIPIHEDCQEYLSFTTSKGKYCYTVMPFGLKIAPAVFQEVMTVTRGDLIGNGVLVYIDDIIIYCKDAIEGRSLLEKVLTKLSEANLKLNKEKCIYEVKEVEYLGFKISQEGYSISNSALKKFREMRSPKDKDELRSYLGLFPFYSELADYNALLTPLRKLNLRRAKKFSPISRTCF